MDVKRKKFIGVLLAFIVVMGLAYYAYNAFSENARQKQQGTAVPKPEEESTDTAPDFTVYDLQNREVKLSDYKGKPVVVNFWASWCPSCRDEMPHFNEAFVKNGDEVVFMMVDLADGQRETVDKGQAFIQQQGYTFPVYFDKDLAVLQDYAFSYIPSTFFIDRNGNIIKSYEGALDEKTLQAGIDLLKTK